MSRTTSRLTPKTSTGVRARKSRAASASLLIPLHSYVLFLAHPCCPRVEHSTWPWEAFSLSCTQKRGSIILPPRSTLFCGNRIELALTVGFKAVGLRMNICVCVFTTMVHWYNPSGKQRTLHLSLSNVNFCSRTLLLSICTKKNPENV